LFISPHSPDDPSLSFSQTKNLLHQIKYLAIMKNFKISTKLFLLIALLIAISIVIGTQGIFQLRKINQSVHSMYYDRVVPLEQLKNVSDAYAVSIVDIAHKYYHGLISRTEALNELKNATVVVSDNWNAYMETKIDGHELELTNEAIELRKESKTTYHDIIEAIQIPNDSLSIATLDQIITQELYQTIDPYTSKISELIHVQLEISEQLMEQAEKNLSKTTIVSIIIMAIAILLAIIFGLFITNGINKSIKIANTAVTKLAKGDLSQEIKTESNDEIGQLLNNLQSTIKKLQEVFQTILSGAENMASSSVQMSSTSQQMAQGANEQASSAEEVSSSMEEMVSNIQQTTENSEQTQNIVTKAVKGIQEGNKSSEIAVESMKNIAEKIKIINDIAFQTNILALNAAVEAARAGEHGKGFAVVAAEVRKLAERSKVAADEIDELSQSGVSISEKAGKQLAEIVPEIEKTANLIGEITAASIEQNSGAEQVNNAIQQLNQVTQQNAASSEEMATSSEELSSQAEQLKDIIGFFKVSGDDHNSQNSSHSAVKIQKQHAPGPKKEQNDNSSKEVDLKMYSENKDDDKYENF
jgi:methyl-accepting chemotaxis protein